MTECNLIYLSKLKELYQKGRVSALIGSGFSKNACPVFPSWNELLFDMVEELYHDEIEEALIRYRKLNPSTPISFAEFQKNEVPRILSRKGYLKVVSEYIDRKGFRESIEQYIEERVPYINAANNQFRFSGKNETIVIDINPDLFSAHVKLIKGSCWERIYTTNYDRLLEHAAKMNDFTITTITQAHQLSVYCDAPTIIKLHGDLYNPLYPPRDFRFDGNSHQQYIISEEDYRNYPKDHEAFTQLMRISLLQGYFCLIGFSGDDPNFVNWIEWVRDILVKDDKREQAQEEKKIFLIGLSKELPQSDKQIFYDNHRIVYIPLMSEEVLSEIGAKAEDSPREVFVQLFDYLEPDKEREMVIVDDGKGPKDVVSLDEVASPHDKAQFGSQEERVDSRDKEEEDRKEYQHLWNRVFASKINGTLPHITETLVVDEEKLARLRQIKIWNRFVNYSDRQKTYLGIIESREKLTIPEAQLAILALRDSGITVDQKMAKLIKESGVGDEDLTQLQKLIHRAETLLQVWESDETAVEPYEKIIRQLFYLNFSATKQLLKEWNAEGVDIIKKAMLLSFFIEDGSKELIVDFLKTETNAKERYYATRLLNMIEGVFPAVHSLARFENANVQNYYEVITNYTRRVKEERVKIGRYGDGKNEKIYMDGNPSRVPEAMAVLNFLIEAPCCVSFRNFYILINPENWYPVHKNLFELYPYASLFYSIQCSDKKVRTRIGQDYAYSDKLAHSCLGEVLVSLLRCLVSDDAPWYLKESVFLISKEMFAASPSSKWEWFFMQAWDELVMQSRFNQTESRLHDALDVFINKGLNSLRNKLLRQRIIRDVLTNSKNDTTFVINCLYYLSVLKEDGEGDDRLSRVVDDFISQLSLPEEITIAGNIYRLLTEAQKAAVSSKCIVIMNEYRGRKIDEVVFRSAQFFMKDSAEGKRVFVTAVCDSPSLWKSGVNSNEGFTPFNNYLGITSFVRKIYVDQESLLRLYEKMKGSLSEVVTFYDLHKTVPILGDFDGLLAEMLSFLNYYEKRLLSQEDYFDVRNKVRTYHQEISGLIAVEDGLHSPLEDEVKKALSFIFSNRDTISHKDFVRYMNMVINRLLMKNSDGLDTCVAYLRLYLYEGLINKEDNEILDGLVQVLDRFTKDVAQECNMELIMTTRDMAKIAMKLSGKGFASKGIDYWIRLQKSGRFYTNFS